MKKTAIAISMAMALGAGAGAVSAATTGPMSSATFTMYDPTGAVNNVDTAVTGAIGGGTWSVASTATYFGLNWAAHNGVTYSAPGTYTVDTIEGGIYTFTVGTGQIGGHILFDWGATANIDVVNVWQVDSGPNYVSTDVDGDGIPGIGMIDGPFPGFSANFDFTAVPVPAAVWLFGSGLVGLVGVARRRRKAA